ncbi:hypothetical protein RJ639_020556 [Escallonia herrerae]|uniref:Cytochrome P450 n=1 Tax=Escallonia herrerae TaxID=1293975 RepID=A0AA89AHL9_9ASTE|nr:hypothetical protein RJ639_020556 [Escallonia herrerae]
MASSQAATQLMAFSSGSTPVVVASDPQTAREILTSAHFANRPIKQSAKQLMFSRAIGFAPNGPYWRLLRRIASAHLFAPKRILAYESGRQLECAAMLSAICIEQSLHGFVALRKHLQAASLNNIVEIVFGTALSFLGAFNWCDYLPWLKYFYDPFRTDERCLVLALRVRKFVERMIEEHRGRRPVNLSDKSDFVDVLLSLHGEEKLNEEDMAAVLWEMIFRGTDSSALLTEWVMAELVLNPQIQAKLQHELDSLVGHRSVTDADVTKLPLLQAVVKETLVCTHPARSSRGPACPTQTSSYGMVIPANTIAMVNMWAITHDPGKWVDPTAFEPERLLARTGGAEVDVRGGDLTLAPFGAGRRACPGDRPVELSEMLKLSCEMKKPLCALAVPRSGSSTT